MEDAIRTEIRKLLLRAAELIHQNCPKGPAEALSFDEVHRRYCDSLACDKILDAAQLVK